MKNLCLGFPICTAIEAVQFSLHYVKTRKWGFLLPQKSWDSEQPPNSSSSGWKENQKKINGNTYTDMYLAIKYSSKSPLVEWTTHFLQEICLGERSDISLYLLMKSFNAQYLWCFWISIPFQLSISPRYSHLSRLQDHWKEILSSHPTTQHTLKCMLGKFIQLSSRRNSFGGWEK